MHAVPLRQRLIPILVALAVVTAVVVALVRCGALEPGKAVEPDAASDVPRTTLHDELDAVSVPERVAAPSEPDAARSPVADAKPARRGRPKGNVTVRLLGPDGPLRSGRVVLTPAPLFERVAAEIGAQFGEARFEEIVATCYAITLEQLPHGWLVSRNAARDEKLNRGGREFAVAEGENILDLPVEPGAVVAGRVFDENGWPAQDVTVQISSLEPRERYVPVHYATVSDGTFLVNVHEGASGIAVMEASAPKSRVPPPKQGVALAAGARADLEFRFERGTETFAGRIVDETGAPFAGLKVGISREQPMFAAAGVPPSPGAVRQPLAGTRTDTDGRFAFEGLPRGKCVVHVEEKGVSPFDSPRDATVARIQHPRTVELPLTEPWIVAIERAHPVLVRGRVLEAKKGRVHSIDVVLPAGVRRATERRQNFNLEHDGVFRFHVDGTETGAVIEVKHDGRVARVPLALAPDSGELSVEIPLP